MALATLSIDLVASLAKFEGDMGRAARIAEQAANRMDRAFTGVGAVFTGSLLAAGAQQLVRSLVTLVPELVNTVAGFQDLEEKTGASAEALASFQTAADVTGVSIDQIAGFMVKLTGTLSKTNEETKGAGAAFKALNIDLDSFKQLAPEQQFGLIAERLSKFADGAGKTSIAIALLGKSGADALPFFKELAATGASQIRLTAEQIRLADDLADRNAKLRSELRQAAQVASLQALPAFNALTSEFLKAAQAAVGLDEAGRALSAGQGIKTFAQDAAISIAVVAESVVGLVKLVRSLGGSFQAVGADLAFLGGSAAAIGRLGPNQGIGETNKQLAALLAERNKVVEEANARYVALFTESGTKVSDSLRQQFSAAGQLNAKLGADPLELARRGRPVAGSLTLPKLPILDFKGSGKGGGDDKALRESEQRRKALLEQALKEEESVLQRGRDLAQFQQRYLDAQYDAGVISLADYHAERSAIEARALDAQLNTYDRQVASLRDFLAKTNDPSEQVATQTRIQEVEAKGARAREQYRQDAILGNFQQQKSTEQLSAAVQDFAAQLLQLQGDEFGAAQIRAQQAIGRAQALAKQSGAGVDVRGFEDAVRRDLQIEESRRRIGIVNEQLSIQEERIEIQRRTGALSENAALSAQGAARAGVVAQLEAQLAAMDGIAKASGNPQLLLNIDRTRLELEKLKATLDPLKDKYDKLFKDAGASAIESLLNGEKGIKGALKDFGNTITRQINSDIAKELSGNLFGKDGAFGGAGGFFAKLFGGSSVAGGAAAELGAQAPVVGAITTSGAASSAAIVAGVTASEAASTGAIVAALGSSTAAYITALGASTTAIVAAIGAQSLASGVGSIAGLRVNPADFFGGGGFGTGSGFGFQDLGLFLHKGGIAGRDGSVTRYHKGGIAGLMPDEVPAILRRGEEVLTDRDPRHRNNARSSGGSISVVNNINISGPVTQRTAEQVARAAASGAQRALARGTA